MPTKNRLRAVLDVGRLAALLAGPGSDTRNWLASARVDDDPDAVRFEPGYGWIVDITFVSGELSGEGPFAARVLSPLGGPSSGGQCPVPQGAEVLVAVVDGSPNVQCVVLGCLHNPLDQPFPSSVQGDPVTEALATENVVAATPLGLRAQFGGAVRVSSGVKASVEAPLLDLAEDGATQPYVRGTDLQTALSSLVSALNVYAAALGPPGPPVPVTTAQAAAAAATLAGSLTSFLTAVTSSLSTRIRGE